MFAARNMMFASAAFSPLSLSPALWLDASDASTLYDSTVGGSLVAADGTIARWEDKSGNARHATQSTGTSQPLRKTAIQNGKDVVRFDGANDNMTHGLTGDLSAFSLSMFVVAKKITEQAGYRGFLAVGPGTGNGSMLLARVGSNKWGTFGSAPNEANSDTGTSSFNLMCMIDRASSGGSFYFNGAADGTWVGDTLGQDPAHVGGLSGQNVHADIAEVLVFTTELSTENRQAVESYLNAKWAIY